jgi:glycosyltransferase involved in cell wall biosynthesis
MSRSICFVGHLMLPLLAGTPEPVVGGAEVQSYHLAQELQRRGWHLSFLVCSLDGTSGGVRSTPLGAAQILYPRRLAKTTGMKLREKRALFAAVARTDADVVFQRAVWDADVAALAARWRRRPYVYSLASDRDAVALPRWSRRRNVLHLAHAVVAQTESQRNWARHYGVESRVIATGFPVPAWNPTSRADVLWVGTLRDLKRPEIFLDLAAAFPTHSFVLCGGAGEDPAGAARVAARAAELPNLRYEGFVPYANIAAHFARARILVNTSSYEGFPNTFVLAWLHGAAVLSLGVDPDARLSCDGLGVVARDPAELVTALGALLADDARCAALTARARAHAEHHHDIRRVASEYEAVFAAAQRA